MPQDIGNFRGLPLHQLPNNGLKQLAKKFSGLLSGRKVTTNAGVKQLPGSATLGPGKKLLSRTAKLDQAKKFVNNVTTLNDKINNQVKQNQQDAKSRRQALYEKQKVRQQRHLNIGHSKARSNNTGNMASRNKSPLGDVTNVRPKVERNNVRRIGQQSVGGSGIVKAQTRQGGAKLMVSKPSDNRVFLQGVKGLSTHVKVLQEQLKKASTPEDIKQAIANSKSSTLSLQQKRDFNDDLRSAMFRLIKNPDSAIKLDETFIQQALKGDSLATSTALNYFNKTSTAQLKERLHLLKNGNYSAPSHTPVTNLSYKALRDQVTTAESINDLKAVLDNKGRTEELTSAEEDKFNNLMFATVTGLSKNTHFASDLTDDFIRYALNGHKERTQTVIDEREKTLDKSLVQRWNNLKKL